MIDKLTESILIEQSADTLAEWWCVLNSWEWPAGLPNPETQEEYERNPTDSRRRAMTTWLTKRLGPWILSRHWNVRGMHRMTAAEHEDFFKGHYEGDKEAAARSWNRLDERASQQDHHVD